MKRILIISITLLFVFFNNTWINAQNTYNSETILIEGGVGVPNFYRMFFRNLELENAQQYTEVRSNGFGPFDEIPILNSAVPFLMPDVYAVQVVPGEHSRLPFTYILIPVS